MLKQLMISAFAVTAVSAFAGEDWSSFDYKTANTFELKKFVVKHAYKTLPAGDAYTIAKFVGDLPGNRGTALLRGLAQNAFQAKEIKDEKQMAANMMAPMGDKMWTMEEKSADSYAMDSSRPMRMLADKPSGDLNYATSLKILTSGLDGFDQGLVWDLFTMKSFTQTLIPTVWHEKELDAITHYIQANAKWTEPYRLKYTSLTPRQPYMGVSWSR